MCGSRYFDQAILSKRKQLNKFARIKIYILDLVYGYTNLQLLLISYDKLNEKLNLLQESYEGRRVQKGVSGYHKMRLDAPVDNDNVKPIAHRKSKTTLNSVSHLNTVLLKT